MIGFALYFKCAGPLLFPILIKQLENVLKGLPELKSTQQIPFLKEQYTLHLEIMQALPNEALTTINYQYNYAGNEVHNNYYELCQWPIIQ